jgi:uncharacterized protein YchJ
MNRFISKRGVIIILAGFILILATYYIFLRENKEHPDHANPSSIVESYTKARMYAETKLVIACIVPEKRSKPEVQQTRRTPYKDYSQYNLKIKSVELNGDKGNVMYHAIMKWEEPINAKEEYNETIPVIKIDGKWYIDREENW